MPWAVRWSASAVSSAESRPEAFHLVDGEDDPAVRGVGLDLPGCLQRGFELRADPHAGGDLLGEDLFARDAVRGQRIQLGLEFLGQVGAAGVADADVRARGVCGDWCRRRGARPPRLAGSAVGRGRHAQFLGQSGDFGEPAGVVGRGDGSGAGPARRSGLDFAAGARVLLDLIGVGWGGGFGLAPHLPFPARFHWRPLPAGGRNLDHGSPGKGGARRAFLRMAWGRWGVPRQQTDGS